MEKITINDLMSYRFLNNVKTAPHTDSAAFVTVQCDEKQNNYHRTIWLWENGAVRQLTSLGEEASFFWEDDEHILFSANRSADEKKRAGAGELFTSWYRLNIHGGEAVKAYELPLYMEIPKKLDDDTWYFAAYINPKYPDPHKMTAEEKAQEAADYAADADYHVLEQIPIWYNGLGFTNGLVAAIFLYHKKTGEIERVSSENFNVQAFNLVGDKIWYAGIKNQNRNTAYVQTDLLYYDLTTKETVLLDECSAGVTRILDLNGEPIFFASDFKDYGIEQNPDICTWEDGYKILCSPDTCCGSTVGSDCKYGGGTAATVYNGSVYYIATVENRAVLQKWTPGCDIETVCNAEGSLDCFDITENGKIYGIGLFENRLQELYQVGAKPEKLTSFNDAALEGKYVAVPEKLQVETCGETIDGWVLYPKDYDPAKSYPAVLDIHGGPRTAYGETFFHEMQVWASEGMFVLFCNPYGSDGKGNRFGDTRFDWGGKDYDTLMAFTDAVLEKYPQIDAKRVAVTGGSYGGFMTNWIITHTDRFACAATQRSIMNWFSMYGVSDIGILYDDITGVPHDKPEEMWRMSPMKYVKNLKTPTLIIHSDEDYRCPLCEGLQLYTSLVDQGVEARMIWFKGENHELSRGGKPTHRLRRLTEITNWILSHTAEDK